MEKETTKKKSTSMYAVVLWAIFIIYISSFIIPSGTFQRDGRMVIPGTYEVIDKIFVSPVAVVMGMGDAIRSVFGSLIITILIVGGLMGVVNSTGAIDQFLARVIKSLKDKAFLLIPAIIFIMGFFGSLGSMISTPILFIPLSLSIAKQMKVDRVFGVALIVLGSYTGFMSSPVNLLTTLMAQEIAEVPAYSGSGYRTMITLFNLTLVSLFLIWYAKRVAKMNKWETDFADSATLGLTDISEAGEKLGWRKVCILLIFAGCFIMFAIGSPVFNIGALALTSIMFPAAFLCGILARYDVDRTMQEFCNGAKNMMGVIVLMMLTCAINVILDQSMIMDSIVYYLSIPLSMMGNVMSSIGIFVVTALINIFIGSGSAKTAMLMPILAPLADVVGVTRQMSILAMQFGDGFTNLLSPINATLLGGLALAKLDFKEWYKMVVPLFIVEFVFLCVFLVIGVLIGF